MHKITLSKYVVGVENLDEIKAKLAKALEDGDDDELFSVASELSKAGLYDVRNSLIEVLFHRDLDLPSAAILEREETARKILHCSNGYVLLEDQEWINLKNAVQAVSGFSLQDSRFIHQIIDAPEVEVEAKECKPLSAQPEPQE